MRLPNGTDSMLPGESWGRTFVLFGGFLAGTLVGGWLGLVAAFVSGIAASGPPRFPGEDLVAAVLAAGVLAAVSVLVYRADGRSARNDLLLGAAFAAFVVLLSVDSTGAIRY